ncbi:alanine or glycine:cation symporter, AGCS family [Palleronia marisminoris]|uniref:Amino-acid carrier protein AlsT n=1 Tax=Palleronia marisminoris TaxID=315423 RepID=A0A1Y5TQX6_9RHOB|nr:alanine/glycine:cation symporter family protein [Palleronia marisminoris]SFH49020.1 alanine or glycine:cation symporter, AGCS family [Palleronia marisminoris]SLN69816.1 Amino-acid carrier protein AlsT [Palleronia marisminoris]
MTAIIDFINAILWGYVLVYGLIAVGLYFTWRTGFIQFRHFAEFFRVITSSRSTSSSGITPFQALTISLASRVGTGNLAGVAVAIYLGGPGAIFWMWMVALVGMATAYAESTLAQLYKIRNADGQYRGGPAFYMERGIGSRAMGYAFSIAFILAFGLIFSAVQANSISVAMDEAFSIPKLVTGIILVVLAGIVIFGGIRSIARVAEKVVPAMAGLYLLVALYVCVINITEIPSVLALIVGSAFGFEQAAGGFTGGLMAALLNGVKRGLFSNEAGMGSAPNIAAVAVPDPHHPSSQGMVQGLGVFIDTLVICTATALMILLSGAVDHSEGAPTGMALTQIALDTHIGAFGPWFIGIAIFFFAFTSILGNYAYAENAMEFLGLGGKKGLLVLKVIVLGFVMWGSLQAVTTVFNLADAAMAIMATINLVAILILSKTVAKLTRDYFAQRRSGTEPVFRIREYPELGDGVDASIWNRDVAAERNR